MKLLYITYIDFGELGSGSSVRPQRMYDAFKELGCDIKLVSGLQNRRKERNRHVKQIIKELKDYKPDACYIEPPSCTIYGEPDHKLIKKVAKMGVPMSVFYRDAHWLFADWWGVKGLKAFLLKLCHRRDLKMFEKYCDKVYFPSAAMRDLFDTTKFRSTGVLPPGCEGVKASHKELKHRLLYVGGVRPAYGTDMMLEAFRIVNQDEVKVSLTLCCRDGEQANLPGESFQEPFLNMVHLQGEELQPLFESCDAGLIPLQRDRYMDFAIPVKMFEYIGNGLPVLATDCPEMANFINENQIGLVTEASAQSLAQAIQNFYADPAAVEELQQNVQNTAKKNRWLDRAQTVLDDLLPKE